MVLKKCIICQNQFNSRDKSITCSDGCKKTYIQNKAKLYYQKNKERIIKNNKIYMKGYYQENKTHLKRIDKKYYQNNKEIKALYQKINKKKINKRNRGRYQNDLIFRLLDNFRSRLHHLLKGNKKTYSIKLLGIDIVSYKKFLENQFNENMNWGNYGCYWEIDHIQPINIFDLSIEKEQLKAFNYKNTRPLPIIENRQRPKDGSDL